MSWIKAKRGKKSRRRGITKPDSQRTQHSLGYVLLRKREQAASSLNGLGAIFSSYD